MVAVCLEAHIVGAGDNLGFRSGASRPAGGCGGIGVILHRGGGAGDLALSAAGGGSRHAETGRRTLISRSDGECPCRIIQIRACVEVVSACNINFDGISSDILGFGHNRAALHIGGRDCAGLRKGTLEGDAGRLIVAVVGQIGRCGKGEVCGGRRSLADVPVDRLVTGGVIIPLIAGIQRRGSSIVRNAHIGRLVDAAEGVARAGVHASLFCAVIGHRVGGGNGDSCQRVCHGELHSEALLGDAGAADLDGSVINTGKKPGLGLNSESVRIAGCNIRDLVLAQREVGLISTIQRDGQLAGSRRAVVGDGNGPRCRSGRIARFHAAKVHGAGLAETDVSRGCGRGGVVHRELLAQIPCAIQLFGDIVIAGNNLTGTGT